MNPVRSTAPAIFVGGWAIEQLWLFWVAPIIGAAVAGLAYRFVLEGDVAQPPITGAVKFASHRRRRVRAVGPIMAAADRLTIDIEGKGGHAARPHLSIDTVLVGAQIINHIQSIVARNVDPLHSAVVSICMFQAGNTDNVIPQTARLKGTARSLDPKVRDLLEERLHAVVEGTAQLYGATAKLTYKRDYPVLRNHERETTFAASVASEVVGSSHVDTDMVPVMGAEDFSFMLEERPGAFIFVGNGASANLHHPAYNFNDEVIPIGTSYWVKLVETALRG